MNIMPTEKEHYVFMRLQLVMERNFGENNPRVIEFMKKCEIVRVQ